MTSNVPASVTTPARSHVDDVFVSAANVQNAATRVVETFQMM